VKPVALLSVSLALFEYSREKKTLQCSSSTFQPRAARFNVVSHHTGETVTFEEDLDDMMSNEFYDGEAKSYRPVQPLGSVVRLFVTNW
jgi:hypothetical protein